MADDLESIAEQSHRLATNYADAHKSAEGLHLSLSKMVALGGGYELMKQAVSETMERSVTVQNIKRAISSDSLNHNKLLERQTLLENGIKEITQNGLAGVASRLTEIEKQKLKHLNLDMNALNAQRKFVSVLEETGKVRLAAFTGIIGLSTDIWLKSKQLNQSLIEANAGYEHRYKLLYSTLFTQIQLGVSFDKATEAAKALVHWGMDTESTYRDNLRIVTQMEQGLDVSVQSAALLASVVERQVHGSFSKVADVVAQLVDDTSLAGAEAVKLATSITQAMGRLSPGMGVASLPEIVKLVGRYEGALKEVGGASGGFEQLISRLTTSEGLVGAGTLGVNPDFLATEKGVQQVMDRFAQFGDRLIGKSRGWERQMRLELLGQQFGTSAEQANQMLIAIERANKQTVGNITLQERWRNQMASVDKGLERLYNSLVGLAQGALYPVIWAINGVINRVADIANWVLQHQSIAVGAMVLLGAGMVGIVGSMVELGAALWTVVVTSNAATAALGRLAAVQAGSSAGSAAGGLGRMIATSFATWGTSMRGFFTSTLALFRAAPLFAVNSAPALIGRFMTSFTTGAFSFLRPLIWLPRLILGLSAPMLALVAGVAVVGGILWKIHAINKESAEANAAAQKIILSMQDKIEAKRHDRLYEAARYGAADDVKTRMQQIYREAGQKFAQVEDPQERMTKMRDWIRDEQKIEAEMLARGVLTRSQFKTVSQTSPEDLKNNKDILDATKEGNTYAQKMWSEAQKAAARNEENKQDAEVQNAKHNAFMTYSGVGKLDDWLSTKL